MAATKAAPQPSPGIVDILPICLLSAAAFSAVAAAWSDWRRRQIPQWTVAGLAGLWALAALLAPEALGGAAWWAALLCGLAALGAGFGFYAAGALGGGDGKLLGALALWLGPRDLGWALLGGAGVLALFLAAVLIRRPSELRKGGLPFGCALAPPAVALLAARAQALAA